jgi:hypothetical protein
MKFSVKGYSKDHGARVQMDIEASSKADAERKAIQSNMEVVRVEQMSEVDPHNATLPGRPAYTSSMQGTGAGTSPRRVGGRLGLGLSPGFKFLLFLAFCVGVAVVIYYKWDLIKKYIPGLH